MANPSLAVLPGGGETPQFVDIDCSGMDASKTIELLINGAVRGSVPVEQTGGATLTYVVPPGPIRNALSDLETCRGSFDSAGAILCGVDGDDNSMKLRYQP